MQEKENVLLKTEGLCIDLVKEGGASNVRAVETLSIEIFCGETVALVGESGCGKTLSALSIMGLLPDAAKISGGSVTCNKSQVGMVFQDPSSALDPLMKVGRQVAEAATVQGHKKSGAVQLAKKIMQESGLSDIERIYNSFPHELSGGQKQRALIAMALIKNPALLIADEPTSALDATVQKGILETISALGKKSGTAMLLITHDLSLVKKYCTRLYIMYAGRIVESGPTKDVLQNPAHPYTRALIDAIPNAEGGRLQTVPGSVPPPDERKETGCAFFPRCPVAKEICCNENPPLLKKDGRATLCFENFLEEK